jgi:hypothetical protein
VIPFRAKPSQGRDDLAKQVSFLPGLLKRGTKGGTAEELISEAKRLRGKGDTPTEIYDATKGDNPNETGLFQNPAGQWVFELSDKDMRLTPEAMSMMRNNLQGGWGDQTGPMDLDRLLKHDLLFDYAPDMRKVRGDFEQPAAGENVNPGGGYSDPGYGRGKGTPQGFIDILGAPGVDPNDPGVRMSVANLAGHETQHALQNRFQMPRGGNANDSFMQGFFSAKMKPQANDIRIKAATERERWVKDWLAGHGDGSDREMAMQQWKEFDPVAAAILEQAVKVGGEPGSFARAGMPAVKRKDPLSYFDQYESLAGEQEARAVQDRMGMTTDQRQADPAFLMSKPKRLSPALQMIRWGEGNFSLPDMDMGLANSVLKR